MAEHGPCMDQGGRPAPLCGGCAWDRPAQPDQPTPAGESAAAAESMVSAPPHYVGHGIQPISFIRSHGMDFLRGNVIKYVTRAPHKGAEVQDLKKAAQYLAWAIEEAEDKDSPYRNGEGT